MVTTTQVRAVMRSHGIKAYNMFTNKTTGERTNARRVKCYAGSSKTLVKDLVTLFGAQNVRTLDHYTGNERYASVIVKCVVA